MVWGTNTAQNAEAGSAFATLASCHLALPVGIGASFSFLLSQLSAKMKKKRRGSLLSLVLSSISLGAGSWELDVKEATSSWVGIYKVFWWLCSEVK